MNSEYWSVESLKTAMEHPWFPAFIILGTVLTVDAVITIARLYRPKRIIGPSKGA